MKPIFDLLSIYDRTRYRSFREFYPEVVDLLNAISDALVATELLTQPPKPFKGPINAVFEYQDFLKRQIIVKPTNIGEENLSPTDYILYRGEELVAQGYYRKNGRWSVAEGNGEGPPRKCP